MAARGKARERNRSLVEKIIQATNQPHAPWIVLASDDPGHRDLSFGRTILDGLRSRLDAPRPAATAPATAIIPNLDHRTVLDALDMSLTLTGADYKARLAAEQDRLAALTAGKGFGRRAVVAVFEGNDAAGKGGSIRRVTAALDPRRFRVRPVAAPTDEEGPSPTSGVSGAICRARACRDLRSLLVRPGPGRAGGELRELRGVAAGLWRDQPFEEELSRSGIIVVKFWLAIDKDEQLRRFQEREQIEFKRFKITSEDWRNREKWDDYATAVNDMVDRTSTAHTLDAGRGQGQALGAGEGAEHALRPDRGGTPGVRSCRPQPSAAAALGPASQARNSS